MTALTQEGTGGTQQQTSGSGGAGSASTSTSSWRDALPESIRSEPSISTFNTLEDFTKSYISTKAMVGKKGVVVPGEKASDQEWDDFYSAIGRPPIDKYEIKTAEGRKADPAVVGKFKEIFHKSGLTPKQGQAIMDAYLGFADESEKTSSEAKKVQVNEGIASLKKEWGQGWDKNVAAARLFLKEHGGAEAMEWQERTGVGNDPTFLKILAKAGSMMGEDRIRGEGGGAMGKTPQEIQTEINQIMADPKYLAGDKAKVDQVSALFQMMDQ